MFQTTYLPGDQECSGVGAVRSSVEFVWRAIIGQWRRCRRGVDLLDSNWKWRDLVLSFYISLHLSLSLSLSLSLALSLSLFLSPAVLCLRSHCSRTLTPCS